MLAISQISRVFTPQNIIIVQQASSKIIEFAKTYFLFISNICLVGLGFRDYTAVALGAKPAPPSFSEFFNNFFQGILSGNLKIIQGSCFVVSGVTGAITFFNPSSLLAASSSTLFVAGNLLALASNIETYIQAVRLSESHDSADQKRARSMMYSAILGMINNINYIMVPLVTLFGGPVALAIFFGGIAVTTGCIKILYDYFYLRTQYPSQVTG